MQNTRQANNAQFGAEPTNANPLNNAKMFIVPMMALVSIR
jgi:hypothetical protein